MASNIFTKEQRESIVDSIKKAELNTSAEIRVHIENHCKGEALDRAVEVFSELKMHKTEGRNGVLIYIAVKDHKDAIIGDVNINKHVSPDFWGGCCKTMTQLFAEGRFAEGICSAIEELEVELKSHFPYRKDDVNELPDDISFGDN
ncbi:MAG: TPM domain-containing protein [Rikenellaceae bacterium]|nr:TPM domain-containing protein [Rikenellaceae bacterium]